MTESLVDSHAHLDGPEFDADRDQVVERARAAGLGYLLLVAAAENPESLGRVISLAESHAWVYAAAGLHPHEARLLEEGHLEALRKLASHAKLLAIGEIGLDYHYDHSPRPAQAHALRRQLELAQELRLPIVIHCREAWSDLREIIATQWRSSGLGGVLHCFSGTREDAFAFLDFGFHISFAGNLTFKKADDLRAVARDIPLDRLLTETDSPYLAPVPHRGKRNEPAFVREVTRELASLRGLSENDMGRQAVENFVRFFKLGAADSR